MKTGNLLKFIAAAIAITIGAAPSAAFSGEGMYTPPPQTQTKDVPTGPTSTPKATDVRKEIASPLREAGDLGKKSDFQGALAKVKEADAVTDKSTYEEYVVASFLMEYSGALKDYSGAAIAINRTLATNAAPEADLPKLLVKAVALNEAAKNHTQAIAAGEQLKKLGTRDAAAETNLALAYFNSGNYSAALKTAKDSLESQTANGGKPIEQTLIVLKNAQIKTGDQKGAIQTEIRLCDISTTEPKAQCDIARKAAQK